MSSPFNVVTYNVERGYHREVILKDLERLMDDHPHDLPDILLLQEVPYETRKESEFLDQLLGMLGEGFGVLRATSSSRYHNIVDGIAMIHKKDFEAVEQTILPLPRYKEVPWVERVLMRGRTAPSEQVVQIVTFKRSGKILRVANLHVDSYGGVDHQAEQVRLALEALKSKAADAYLLGGDFNTKRTPKLKGFPHSYPKMVATLVAAGFRQLDQVKETMRVATRYPGPHEPIGYLQKLLALLHLNVWSQKLDFLFGSDTLEVLFSKSLPIQGSDHWPVLVQVSID